MKAQAPAARVLLASRPDTASCNIRDRVRELAAWRATQRHVDDIPIHRLEDAPGPPVYLAEIDDWHIRREGIGESLQDALGEPIEAILVLSRHRAASGQPSLTAHPVGNPGPTADAGGAPRTPTPTHPHILSAAFRALNRHREEAHIPHEVSLEATHHGPATKVPLLFIEVGSDERHWADPTPGQVVARAALEAARHVAAPRTRTFMGIGGGHYAPRAGAILAETTASVGHVLASHHWDHDDPPDGETIERFLIASAAPGEARASCVYLDKKSFRGPVRREILAQLERLEVPVVRTRDLAE